MQIERNIEAETQMIVDLVNGAKAEIVKHLEAVAGKMNADWFSDSYAAQTTLLLGIIAIRLGDIAGRMEAQTRQRPIIGVNGV